MSIPLNNTGQYKPVLFPNMERLLNDIRPLRKITTSYKLDGNIDNLSKDELWLLLPRI